MPDITMCQGTGCSVKQDCWRYLATPSFWQSYFAKPPGKDQKCQHFVKFQPRNAIVSQVQLQESHRD